VQIFYIPPIPAAEPLSPSSLFVPQSTLLIEKTLK